MSAPSLSLALLLGLFFGALNAAAMMVPKTGRHCTGALAVKQLGNPEMLGCVGKKGELVVLTAGSEVIETASCGWYLVEDGDIGELAVTIYPLGHKSPAVNYCRLHPSTRKLDCTLWERSVSSNLKWAPATESFPGQAHLRPADLLYLENGAERMNFLFSNINGQLVSNPKSGEYAIVCQEDFVFK